MRWVLGVHVRPESVFKLIRIRNRYVKVFNAVPAEGFAGILDVMDVYLDCPVFSGYTTAHTAIQKSIPIVTLEGEFMWQRLAAGLLRQIEQTETIVSTRDAYVDMAVSLGKESALERAGRRDSIRAAAPPVISRL